jgi:hypothetical protein
MGEAILIVHKACPELAKGALFAVCSMLSTGARPILHRRRGDNLDYGRSVLSNPNRITRDVLDKLKSIGGPGESYSDVIVRIARE